MSWGGFADAEALRTAARDYLIAGWHDHDIVRVRGLVTPDFEFDLVGRDDEVGIDWYLGFLKMARDAVDGLDVEFRELIVEDDDVGVHLVLLGTQAKKLFGVPSRGSSGAIDVMTRLQFRDRKVARQSSITDFAALQAVLKG